MSTFCSNFLFQWKHFKHLVSSVMSTHRNSDICSLISLCCKRLLKIQNESSRHCKPTHFCQIFSQLLNTVGGFCAQKHMDWTEMNKKYIFEICLSLLWDVSNVQCVMTRSAQTQTCLSRVTELRHLRFLKDHCRDSCTSTYQFRDKV